MNISSLPRQAIIKASTHWLKIAKEDRERSNAEKRLWSIAAEVEIAPKVWRAEVAEVMASDSTSALATYFVSQPHRVNIVGVAPTLGFWVNDKDGNVLSTT